MQINVRNIECKKRNGNPACKSHRGGWGVEEESVLSNLQRSCGFGQGPRRRTKERRSPAVRAPPPWGTIPWSWLPTSLMLLPRALVRCSCCEQNLASPILSLSLSETATCSAFFLLSFRWPLFLCASSSSSLHPLFGSYMPFSSISFILSFVLDVTFHPSPSSSSIRSDQPPTQGWPYTRSKTN